MSSALPFETSLATALEGEGAPDGALAEASSAGAAASRPSCADQHQTCEIDERTTEMLKIRLSRGGAKKRPHYSIVIADARAPRDGRFIEIVGVYDPRAEPSVDADSCVPVSPRKCRTVPLRKATYGM